MAGRPKGIPKTGGRKAGTPNKVGRGVRVAFEEAFEALQEDPEHKLDAWAKKNPTEFYKLSSKLIPAQVDATVKASVSIVSEFPDG